MVEIVVYCVIILEAQSQQLVVYPAAKYLNEDYDFGFCKGGGGHHTRYIYTHRNYHD